MDKEKELIRIPRTKILCKEILTYILNEEDTEMVHLLKKEKDYLRRTYELLARRINLIEKRNKGCV